MNLILEVLALTVAGLMVGVELCVALFVNPIVDRLPGSNGLLARADGARLLGKVMPFWYSAAIVLSAVLVVTQWDSAGTWAIVTGCALFVASIVMSIVLLVPINNRSKDWTPDTAPADWRDQLGRWDRLHDLRLLVITAGFVFLAVGALQLT